jgi:hypothetical protein
MGPILLGRRLSVVAGVFHRGAKTDQMLTTMTAIQDAIEAIDRAIEDERKGR